MNISYKDIPIDVIFCMILSLILVPISLLNIEGTIRIILGIPFILFIPGYILIFVLFPNRKTDQGLEITERIGLSFGLSIALVPLICLILNYTLWGIQLESVLFSIFIFINSLGFIAFYRWKRITPDKRFTISLNLSGLKSQNKLDFILNILIILSILIACVLPIYIIYTPKIGEKFTEFYLVGLDTDPKKYSKNLTMQVNTTRLLEIINHEYKTINYTVEIWLINQSYIYNESKNTTQNIINNMWFMYKTTTGPLNHVDVEINKKPKLSWTYNYSFSINMSGTFKLTFLLFKTSTENYTKNKDYKKIAEQKISEAYREVHQWINVYYRVPLEANFTYSPDKPNLTNIIYFTSNCYSPAGKIIKMEWDFGDGNTSYGKTIELDFDGIDDYVNCGKNSTLQPVNGTIEAWIYPRDLIGRQIIFSGQGAPSRRHPSFFLDWASLNIILTNNTISESHTCSQAVLQPYTWYHVAANWDGLNVKFYVNGLLKEIQTQNLTPDGNTDLKDIGFPYPLSTFNGSMKDIKIYNRTLNQIEILNNYNGNVTIDGLVSWWKMNDNENIVYDSMGLNNGNIYGANWVKQAIHKYSLPNSYKVKLTIWDEYGRVYSISKDIIVT